MSRNHLVPSVLFAFAVSGLIAHNRFGFGSVGGLITPLRVIGPTALFAQLLLYFGLYFFKARLCHNCDLASDLYFCKVSAN